MAPLGETPPVVNVNDLLEDIAQLVAKGNYRRALYVVDDKGKLVGILMLHKLLKHLLKGKYEHMTISEAYSRGFLHAMFSTVAGDLMKRDVVFLYEDDSVEKAIELMAKHGLKDIPVVNREKKVVGFVDLPVIIKFILKHQI